MKAARASIVQRIRTLPIRVDPLSGEALDSWLEVIAAQSLTAWGDLLDAVGLTGPTVGTAAAVGSPVLFRPRQLDPIAAATTVSPELLARMTLDALLPGTVRTAARRDWEIRRLLLVGSRFCPICLASNGGRWPLWWRLRWAFACPTHACLLAQACHVCGGEQRARALPTEQVPTPGCCMRPAPDAIGRLSRRCGAHLSTAAAHRLPRDHPALTAQQAIRDVVAAGSTAAGIYGQSPVSAAQYMKDLAAVGMRALRYGSREDLHAALSDSGDLTKLLRHIDDTVSNPLRSAHVSAPTTAHAALAACVATPILSADSSAAAGERLRWLIATSRGHGLAVSATNIGWARDISAALSGAQLAALAPFLGPSDQVRYRCLTSHPKRPSPGVPETYRWLPAMLWQHWAARLCDSPIRLEIIRSALSVAVVITSGRVKQHDACSLLGGLTTTVSVSRVLQALAKRPDWAQTTEMLAGLADLLTAHRAPIDYDRRRRLPMDDLLPEPRWHDTCRRLEIDPGSGIKIRIIRCWLYERITGSPGRHCQHAGKSNAVAASVADLPRTLFPELIAALDEVAREFLDDNGLTHEPLRWSPPDEVAPDWMACRPRHATVDVRALHDLIGARDVKLGAAATRLGTTIDIVREVLSDNPAPRRMMTPGQLRAAGLRAKLSPDRFADLYLRQKLGLKTIAAMVGVSRNTVTRLAHEYGIPLRPPPAHLHRH